MKGNANHNHNSKENGDNSPYSTPIRELPRRSCRKPLSPTDDNASTSTKRTKRNLNKLFDDSDSEIYTHAPPPKRLRTTSPKRGRKPKIKRKAGPGRRTKTPQPKRSKGRPRKACVDTDTHKQTRNEPIIDTKSNQTTKANAKPNPLTAANNKKKRIKFCHTSNAAAATSAMQKNANARQRDENKIIRTQSKDLTQYSITKLVDALQNKLSKVGETSALKESEKMCIKKLFQTMRVMVDSIQSKQKQIKHTVLKEKTLKQYKSNEIRSIETYIKD
eukprot:61759_1